jgi:hypothetical protein
MSKPIVLSDTQMDTIVRLWPDRCPRCRGHLAQIHVTVRPHPAPQPFSQGARIFANPPVKCVTGFVARVPQESPAYASVRSLSPHAQIRIEKLQCGIPDVLV